MTQHEFAASPPHASWSPPHHVIACPKDFNYPPRVRCLTAQRGLVTTSLKAFNHPTRLRCVTAQRELAEGKWREGGIMGIEALEPRPK